MAGLIKRLNNGVMRFSCFRVVSSKAIHMICKPNLKIKQTSSSYSVYCAYHVSHHVCIKSQICTVNTLQKYSTAQIVSFKLSDIGEGIREVTIKEWFVKVGDKVSQFDNICEVQSDKASVTITSRYDGVITKLHYNVDDTALVGNPLVDLEVFDSYAPSMTIKNNRSSPNPCDVTKNLNPVRVHGKIDNRVLATPAVRRIASEENIDLKKISGTGHQGRVLKEDVLSYIEGERKTSSQAVIHKELAEDTSKMLVGEHSLREKNEIIRKPIRGFAKTMVKTMTLANGIPDFVYCDEINVTKISNVIEELKKSTTGVRFTYMSFFIKATSNSLLKFPILNSSLDEKCENILYKTSHNIGVAMDTPDGLVVPNIKHVEKLGIVDIAKELMRLHKDGLSGSLRSSDLTGGTFTLSNIGSIGGTYTKPIILPPEVAIGGIGSIQIVPRYDEMGNLVKTKIVSFSWTADHRIIDGATMARFSNTMKSYIQNPYHLMLNL